jgi:TIR domain
MKHAAGSIFISYRREDTQGEAGHLLADLRRHFGDERVFFDVATIRPGEDFRKAVEKAVGSCAVLLVVIGKKWLTAADASGRRRLDDPRDFVRFETAVALRRDVRVIPVLVQGAAMPNEEELPDDLKDMVWRNAQELSHGRWEYDASRLVKAIELAMRTPEESEDKTHAAPAAREPELRTAPEPERTSRPDAAPGTSGPAVRQREAASPNSTSFVRKPVAIAVAAVVLALGVFGVSTLMEDAQPNRSPSHATVPDSAPVVDQTSAGSAANAAPLAKDAAPAASNASAIAPLIYQSAANTKFEPTRLFGNGQGDKRAERVCKDQPTEQERIRCELNELDKQQQEMSRELNEMDEKAKAAIRHIKAG